MWAINIKLQTCFPRNSFCVEIGVAASTGLNGATVSRHVKSNFTAGTMNFSFQESLRSRRWEKMFPFTVLRPLDSHSDLGKPHQTSELACVQFGPIPCCAEQHCVSQWPDLLSMWTTALSQLLWLPQPNSGCWPTWNTIQVSSGPLTVHTPHFTTGQTVLSIDMAPQKQSSASF